MSHISDPKVALEKSDDDHFPMPGEQVMGCTVIASVYYRESDEELRSQDIEGDLFTLLLLRAEPPYYWVVTCYRQGDGWYIDNEERHMNIVPAVVGDHPYGDLRKGKNGYTDMGGDY